MSDTITLNAGAGGATLGTDEVTIGGTLQHVQRMKLVDGADGGTALIGGDAANGLDVDVTRVGGNVTVVGAAADGAAASGNPVLIAGFDGTNAQSISTTSSGHVQVHDGGNSITVDNAGTFAVQVDGSALTSLQLLDDVVYTDDAAFTPATSKVVAIGAQADESGTDSVDEGDVGALRMTLDRLLRVLVNRESGKLYAAGTSLTVKYAAVAASSSGDNEIVAAVTSKKIRVLSYVLSAAGTVNAKWQSSTAGDLTGLIYMVANSGAVANENEDGWFETTAGEALQLNLSGAIAVGGHLSYVEV